MQERILTPSEEAAVLHDAELYVARVVRGIFWQEISDAEVTRVARKVVEALPRVIARPRRRLDLAPRGPLR